MPKIPAEVPAFPVAPVRYPAPRYRGPMGRQQGGIRALAPATTRPISALSYPLHVPAFGLVQISHDLSAVGLLPDRPVRRALLAWRIPRKLADGRPLQCGPFAAAVAAY